MKLASIVDLEGPDIHLGKGVIFSASQGVQEHHYQDPNGFQANGANMNRSVRNSRMKPDIKMH